VTGGKPKDLDPTQPESLGRLIELEAEVMHAKDRGVYLTYLSSRF
jgi:hypothetical protein